MTFRACCYINTFVSLFYKSVFANDGSITRARLSECKNSQGGRSFTGINTPLPLPLTLDVAGWTTAACRLTTTSIYLNLLAFIVVVLCVVQRCPRRAAPCGKTGHFPSTSARTLPPPLSSPWQK